MYFVLGYMFDAFGSYNEGLILMGAFIAVSGLMLYPIPCIRTALEKVNFLTWLKNIESYNFIQKQSKGFSDVECEPSIIKKDALLKVDECQDGAEDNPVI